MGFKRIVAAAIALALLVAGLGAFLIFTQVETLSHARSWLDHTRTVIAANQTLLGSIQELEDGERGDNPERGSALPGLLSAGAGRACRPRRRS